MSISKIAMLTFGMAILTSLALISNPVYAPNHINGASVVCGNGIMSPPEECDGFDFGAQTCAGRGFAGGGSLVCTFDCLISESQCIDLSVAGTPVPIDTTMILLGATKTTASWMIPVIVAGIGIAIVIARSSKFTQ